MTALSLLAASSDSDPHGRLISAFHVDADKVCRHWSGRHYLGRDVQLAEAAMLKLEQRTKLQTVV